MVEQAALEAIGLFKRYGDHQAVNGVDLVVRPGEIHGLLGPNGAGKTTLMRMLLGLVRPDAGSVRLLGQEAGTTAAPVPSGVAGCADAPRFYPYLSGRQNLRLLARLDVSSSSREANAVEDVLRQVGLDARADAKVGGYSAGMKQRLGLAAALLRAPRLLLLDEPTNSLDPASARDLRAHVRRLARAGTAVLLSSHDMVEVEDLCDTLTIVHRGRIAFSGTVLELRKRAGDAMHALETSDNDRARVIAETHPEVHVTRAAHGTDGLEVRGTEAALDEFVMELGRAGVAIRRLERKEDSLETLFLELTSNASEAIPTSTTSPPEPLPNRPRGEVAPLHLSGVRAVVATECGKLTAQPKVWAVLATCVAAPMTLAIAVKLQNNMPEDTLFGRWVNASGFAVPLLVLGFAASWAFPALASVVSGDLFSAEDRYGTWQTLLTRSRSRGEVFLGKALTAVFFSLFAVTTLGLSSIAAGVIVIGRQPLIGLSGTALAPGQSLALVGAAWASVLPPMFGFAALAALLSTASRSSAAGVGLPVLIGFAMELYAFVNGPAAIRRAMLTSPFVAWHGLFTEHRFYGPLIQGTLVSAAYLVICLAWAYVILRRRDMGG